MDDRDLRRLTGMISLRLWVVAIVAGAVGSGLLYLRVPLGPALVTLATLVVPLAVVSTLAWVTRRRADRIPRWMGWAGGAGTAVGVTWLLFSPGEVPAVITFALGVWLLVVGVIAGVIAGRPRLRQE